jgi:hypothetical protein
MKQAGVEVPNESDNRGRGGGLQLLGADPCIAMLGAAELQAPRVRCWWPRRKSDSWRGWQNLVAGCQMMHHQYCVRASRSVQCEPPPTWLTTWNADISHNSSYRAVPVAQACSREQT